MAPFALAVRCLSPSTDGSYNQQVRYSVGADDTGVAPSTPLFSALVDFDICPGVTVIPSTGFADSTYNNVKAFSLSFGGTNAAPGDNSSREFMGVDRSRRGTQFFRGECAT